MKVLEKGHITDTALEEYSLDHLVEPELEVVEEHILICPTCQDRLKAVDDFVRAFRTAHRALEGGQERLAAVNGKTAGGPRTTIVLGDEVFAPEISAPPRTIPAPAWFQRPAAWAGLALVLGLLLLAPLLGRREEVPAEAPKEVLLVAERGAGGVAEAAAGSLALNLDLRGVSGAPVLVELSALTGEVLWSRAFAATPESLRAETDQKLAPGQYWVRVLAAGDRTLLREFGLRLR